jgi:hypothetical protein
MKRGWWLVGVLLAWTSCSSSSAKPPVDAAATADAAPAAPDGSAGSDAAVDTAAATDGAADAGSDGTDATLAAASTWTGIYDDFFTNPANPSNCMGSSCHDPGIQKGIDLSTAAKGFATLQSRIVRGQPSSSSLYTHLASGAMPLGRPRFSDAELARVRAWILAGAPND